MPIHLIEKECPINSIEKEGHMLVKVNPHMQGGVHVCACTLYMQGGCTHSDTKV
jgi:hypothetical protein